jgi:tetratricopeptide (TPR) repeat protein
MIGAMATQPPIDDASKPRTVASSPTTNPSLTHQPWLLALVLAIVTFVVYFPALHGGFVFDDVLIIRSPLVHASDGLYRFWFTKEASDYYPLSWSLWWAEWQAWGMDATGYHVVNVLLHAVNAILIWTVLRRLKIPGAWLAALVFAIHPVNAATVAWISEQKNTLSMLFYALAILLYLRFDEKSDWRWYAASLMAFLLALFSKTAVVMLPVVLLGCVWWQRGRMRSKDLLRTVPFFIPSLVSGLVTIWFQHEHYLIAHPVRNVGFPFRLAAAGWVPWFYLYKALLPLNLSVIYPQWHINVSQWTAWLPGAFLVGCFILFWVKRNTWGRSCLFGLGYFVVMLFPVLGFFDQGFYQYSLVSDHWQYYSIIGVIALVVAAAVIGWRTNPPGRALSEVTGVAIALLLGAATWTRAGVYATSETLWRDTLAKNPNAWMAHNNLGLALQGVGNIPEAIEHYEQAVRLNPGFAEAHNNFGSALQQAGNLEAAREQYEQAVRLAPDYAHAHNNLGVVLFQLQHLPEAKAQYEEALRLEPDYAKAHVNLGLVLAALGNVAEAMQHWEQALRINPNSADAHYYRGLAFGRTGRTQEAIEEYNQALRLNPNFAEARNALARLQSGQ